MRFEPCRIDAVYDTFYTKDDRYTKESFRNFVLALYDKPESLDTLKFILKQHDQMLIKRWNETISSIDTVWFLGDLSFGGRGISAGEYFKQLHGHIRLIKGNHDKKSDSFYLGLGFEYVSPHPVILKQKYILSHAPLLGLGKDPYYYYVYGHVHGGNAYETWTALSCCACVERHDFRPFKIPGFEEAVEPFDEYHPNFDK